MDQNTLDELLKHLNKKQFWLKPIGPPKDHPDWDAEECRTWTESELEIHFAKNPARLGSILRGNDKACIPREFAEFLIRQIRAA